MLKVTIELWPGGRMEAKRELAVMHISNVTDPASTSGLDDYAVYVAEHVNPVAQRGRWESRGLLCGLARDRSVFALLAAAADFGAKESEKR
jgi:hypothetical protein